MNSFDATDSWSPPALVIDSAKRLIADPASFGLKDTPEFEALVIRLCTDRRMQSVWRELLRSNGKDKFLYPPKLDSINPYSGFLKNAAERAARLQVMENDSDTQEERKSLAVRVNQLRALEKVSNVELLSWPVSLRQQSACASFFVSMVQYAASEVAVFTRVEVDMAAQELRSIADKLEFSSELAAIFLRVQVPVEVALMTEQLRKAALSFDIHKGSRLMVKRRRSDDRMRTFAIRLDDRAQEIFGQHFYGLIAAVSNVVFEGSKATQTRIRAMVRPKASRRSGVKRPKEVR